MGHYTLDQLADFYLAFILRALRTPGRAGLPIPEPIPEASKPASAAQRPPVSSTGRSPRARHGRSAP
jgi:hypothetical protein